MASCDGSLVLWLCVLSSLIVVCRCQLDPDDMVICYADDECITATRIFPAGELVTVRECCTNTTGLSMRDPEREGCFRCIVYGWEIGELTAIERAEPYTVNVQLLKGRDTIFFANPIYRVVLEPGGNATQGTDFTFDPVENIVIRDLQTFPGLIPNPTPVNFNLTKDGVERETNEVFTLTLELTSGFEASNAFITQRLEVTIQDGDFIDVNLTSDELLIRISENETSEVCISASPQDFLRTIPVDLLYTSGTAQESTDYNPIPTSITISPQSGFRVCFDLSIVDDDRFEAEEDFYINITSTDDDTTILTPAIRVVIEDDDPVVIGWEAAQYSVTEGDDEVVTVCVAILEGFLISPIPDLTVTTIADTAEENIDFIPISESFNFPLQTPGASMCFNITIQDDEVFEPITPDFFTVEIEFAGQSGILIQPETTRVNITDDERISIGNFTTPTTIAEQEDEFELCLTKVTPLADGTQGSVETVVEFNVTLEIIVDENQTEIVYVILPPEMEETCFRFPNPIPDDNIALEPVGEMGELRDMFTVRIIDTDPSHDTRIVVDPDTLEVFLADDDFLRFEFLDDLMVREEEGILEVCLPVSNVELFMPVNLTITYQDETAESGSDYFEDVTVKVLRGNTDEECFNITIVDDEIHEISETFVFSLNSTDPRGRVQFARNSIRVTIIDDDVLTLGWSNDSYFVSESDGEVEVCASVLEGGVGAPVPPLDVLVGVGTAESGVDYGDEATPSSLQFEPNGDTELCATIEILDDNLIESFLADEDFSVRLMFPAGSSVPDRINVMPDMARVFIEDNDIVVTGFEEATVTTLEGSTEFAVCFVKNLTVDSFTFEIAALDGTAVDLIDYNASAIDSEVIMQPTDTLLCVEWPALLDDSIPFEPDKSFFVKLTGVDPESPRIVVDIDEVEVIIVDDDILSIGFLDDQIEVFENDSLVEICVGASYPVDFNLTLEYEEFLAREGSDFEILVSTLQFRDTSTEACFNVSILNDEGFEEDESFEIVLVESDTRVELTQSSLVITIRDEDTLYVEFVDDEIEVSEDVGSIEICVNASAVNMRSFMLVYTSESAEEGSDFIADKDELQFDFSTNQACFAVGIVDDDNFEELLESFSISLTSTNPRVNITQGTLPVIIEDNEDMEVEFQARNLSVLETDGAVTVCVTRDTPTEIDFSVKVESEDGTATAGLDYEPPANLSVSFTPAGNTTQCFEVAILSDDMIEPTETFVLLIAVNADPRIETGAIGNVTIRIIDPTPVNRIDVNDTITGDPVLTVPILVPEDQLQQIDADQLSLCYEVHGDTDTWFNLVSDKCASVNAHYEGIAERLNVIDVIGIRTTDNFGNCVNISVSLQDSCSPVINGTAVSRYSVGGVRVRTMANRVRISLPNCNDVALVMWVICESREFKVELNDVETEVIGDVIKYVITRGLNYGRLAHGLLGQFWNIPVSIAPFDGNNIDGEKVENVYVLNITTPSEIRSYTGMLSLLTWELEEGPCLYVGDSQSDRIYEIEYPNDRVIEGLYTDYIVSGSFAEDFPFGLFDEEMCSN